MAIKNEEYKAKLIEEKELLESELGKLGIKDPATGDWGALLPEIDKTSNADPNDRGDRDEEFGQTSQKVGELEIRLHQVDLAIKKMEAGDGTFGICEIGNEQIEEDRLNANPAARTCKTHINENPDQEQ
jgi:RNA polymerase-binding transcription factor DksA